MALVRVSAQLDRSDNGTPWGFRMTGGKDFGAPLVVQKVNPGSLSERCGLKEGDSINDIGGYSVDMLSHKEAQELIMSQGNSLNLKLERDSGYGALQQPFHHEIPSHPPFSKSPISTFNITPTPFGNFNKPTSNPLPPNYGVQPSQDYTMPWSRPNEPAAQQEMASWIPQMPTGERKIKLGKAGEAQTRAPVMGGSRIPVCATCQISIRGPFISALDKTWCPDHFVCSNPQCKQPLVGGGFVEERGEVFCVNDFEKYLAPKCAQCSMPIVGDSYHILGLYTHPKCLTCTKCLQLIPKHHYLVHDGELYCFKDWTSLFGSMCYGCKFPIEDNERWVEALSQTWHPRCFNCSSCQINLDGKSFCNKAGKPYCKKHGTTARGW